MRRRKGNARAEKDTRKRAEKRRAEKDTQKVRTIP